MKGKQQIFVFTERNNYFNHYYSIFFLCTSCQLGGKTKHTTNNDIIITGNPY